MYHWKQMFFRFVFAALLLVRYYFLDHCCATFTFDVPGLLFYLKYEPLWNTTHITSMSFSLYFSQTCSKLPVDLLSALNL